MAMNYPYPTSSPTSSGAYTTGIRSALKEKGIADEQITYDPNKGVLVGGTPFIRPEKNYAGSTYTSPQNFQSAWDAYSKSLNKPTVGTGYTGSGVGVGAAAGYTPSPTGTTAGYTQPQPVAQPNQLNDQINKIIQSLQTYGQNQPAFDPYSSSAYQAAQAQTQRQSQQGIRQAQEAFGSAGFGRSTGLGERAQRIGQEGTDYLMTQVIPQIQAQEQARKQQEYQNILTSLQPLLTQQSRADELAQQARSREDQLAQQNIANAMQQAQLTGTYIPQGSQDIINQLIGLKNQAETAGLGGATAETMAQFQSQGDALRNQLAALGIDVSGLGAETSAADVRFPRGVQTLESKQIERKNYESDRQFEFAKGQQAWENTIKQAQFDENKAQQAWENTFKERDFAQSMQEAAAGRGLQWASLDQRTKEFVADQAFKEKQFAFEQQQAGVKTQGKEASSAAYSEFLTDLPRIASREEGMSLVDSYRQEGIDEGTLQTMLKAINSQFKE